MTPQGSERQWHFRARQSDSGSLLVLTALMMSVLMGVLALAIDGSYLYEKRNRLSAVADAAAKSVAMELARQGMGHEGDVCTGVNTGPGICPNLKAFANHEAALSAYGITPANVVMNRPPLTGAFAGNIKYVEVIVSQTTETLFGGVVGLSSMTPSARAVGGGGGSIACMYALDTVAMGGTSFSPGNGDLDAPGCAIVANGGMTAPAGFTTTASTVSLGGTCSGRGCPPSPPLVVSQPIVADPLISLQSAKPSLATATANGPCTVLSVVNTPGATTTMNANGWKCYTSIFVGGGNSTLNFLPCNYYVNGGDLNLQNGDITGSGVFIFVTGAAHTMTIGAHSVTLSASTAGTYAGIVYYQDNTTNFGTINNGTFLNIDGAFYLPGSSINLPSGGNIGALGMCSIIVARKISTNNGVHFESGCPTNFGFSGSLLGTTASVAE